MDDQTQVPVAENRKFTGGHWLYLIAALTAVNTVIVLSGGEFSMIFGLTSALVVSYLFSPVISVVFTLLLAGVIAGLGYLTNQRLKWALILGMVVYAIDALVALGVILYFEDSSTILDLAAHGYGLFLLGRYFVQLRAEVAVPAAPGGYPVQPFVPEQPVPQPEQL